MPTKAQLPILAAKIAAQVARERLAPIRATSLGDVPPSASALTTEWLTAVLCRQTPDATVTAYEVVGGSDGTSSRRALRVSYNAAGQQAGLPTRLFMKSAASFQSRLMLGLGGVTESETISTATSVPGSTGCAARARFTRRSTRARTGRSW